VTETDKASARVEAIEVPAAVRELTAIEPIAYEDCFAVEPAPAAWRPAELAARAVLDEAPVKLRAALLQGWSSLGLRLDPESPDRILGWHLRRSNEDVAIVAADSPLGIAAELVFTRQGEEMIYATFVRLDGADARAAWAQIEPVHPPMVKRLLEGAAAAAG
jgi:hypothetical protein